MKKVLIITLFAAVAWCAGTAISAAQTTDTLTVTINAAVSATAKLTLDGAHNNLTINFPDADPDTSPTLSAAAITVDAKGKTSAGNNITLTVLADHDLTSGTDTIGIANITWTATGAMSPGTMSTTVAQTLGSWAGSGNRNGTQTYVLANSWSYAVGNYHAVVTYLLSAP